MLGKKAIFGKFRGSVSTGGKKGMADQYEGQKWFFPFPDDDENGDLVERVIDARCAYWTSRPVTKDELAPDVKMGASIE